MVWEVIEDHVVKEPEVSDYIGLREFNFSISDEYEGGGWGREVLSDYPHPNVDMLKVWYTW